MPFDKHILSIVEDPSVRRTKHMVLEHIGLNVVSVGSLREVEYVSARSYFDLVLIGRSFSETRKLAIAQVVRLHLPKTPILEMFNHAPVIPGAEHVLNSHDPEDLAETVKEILQIREQRKQA
jgi:DNA-binding NtrC family response regulator